VTSSVSTRSGWTADVGVWLHVVVRALVIVGLGRCGQRHPARSSPMILPRVAWSRICRIRWIGGRLRRAAIADSTCVLHERVVSSAALTAQTASPHSSAGLGGPAAGEFGSSQPFLPARGCGLSSTQEPPGQSGDYRQDERNCDRYHEWAIHAVTVRTGVNGPVSGVQADSSVALLVRVLLMACELAFRTSVLVGVGRPWWAFDGPATAQTPRDGPGMIFKRWPPDRLEQHPVAQASHLPHLDRPELPRPQQAPEVVQEHGHSLPVDDVGHSGPIDPGCARSRVRADPLPSNGHKTPDRSPG
jgi:hypothetical protein